MRGAALIVCAGQSAVVYTAMALALGPAAWAQSRGFLPTSTAVERFPYASALDLGEGSSPAGSRGFVTTARDGTFRFGDGTRARFFGVNIAKDALFVGDAEMDQMVETIRAAGLNIVRLHHFDGPEGILGPERDELDLFTAAKLERIDRWIARLKQAGIYTYLDILDYRTFGAADGIRGGERLGRGAKPYVVFDAQLRALVKEYAEKLLTRHVNRYTGLSYASDPAIAFIELYDENGLFIRRGDVPRLRAPYRQGLARMWNAWLREQYGTTEALRKAWTDPTTGQCALQEHESLEQGNLDVPRLEQRPATEPMPNQGNTGAARMNDAARFFAAVQQRFFREMVGHLRSIGVRVPIGAVGSLNEPPDHAAMASALDFIGTNFYWDHPAWQPGRPWRPPYWFANRSPLGDDGLYSLGQAVAAARVAGTALVLREWSYCWPNEYRAAGTVELAAFCAHQGIDCVMAFTYGAGESPPITEFDMHADEARWGLLGHAARLYLHGGIQPASTTVDIAHSPTDLYSYYEYGTPLLALAYVTRVQRRYGDSTIPATATLTVASGRSANLAVTGSRRLLWNWVRRSDLRGTISVDGVVERSGYRVARALPDSPKTCVYDGFIGDVGDAVTVSDKRLYVVEDIRKQGFAPIGVSQDGKAALGFADPGKQTWALGVGSPATAAAAAFDALGRLGPSHVSHANLSSGRMVTDTRQIVRDTQTETVTVVGEYAVGVAATRRSSRPLEAGQLSVDAPSAPFAAIAVSLDGAPLGSAERVSIRYVTTCVNTGETLRREQDGPKPWLLAFGGMAPAASVTRPSSRPLSLGWKGSALLRIFAEDGSYELLLDGPRLMLIANAPGIRVADRSGRVHELGEGPGVLLLSR